MSIRIQRICVCIGGVVLLFTTGCGNKEPEKTASAEPARTAIAKQPKAPFVPVDACSLLTKPEVEELARRSVMEPRKEQAANLVTCSFGDPKSPQVGGRVLSNVVSLSVFTGEEGAYYAGPVAQAKDTYEMAHKNAGSDEPVSGLGESAYWDKTFRTLNALKTKCFVTVTVEADGGVDLAKKLMSKALGRLP